MRFDLASFHADQHFRRRADDRFRAHADEEHVRRGIDVAQRAIHVERMAATSALNRCESTA
jgi:hypothetical protein